MVSMFIRIVSHDFTILFNYRFCYALVHTFLFQLIIYIYVQKWINNKTNFLILKKKKKKKEQHKKDISIAI